MWRVHNVQGSAAVRFTVFSLFKAILLLIMCRDPKGYCEKNYT